MYSKEEIEKKRLSALALKQKKNTNSENTPAKVPVPNLQNKTNFQGTSSTNSFPNKSGVFRQKPTQKRFDPLNTNKFYGNNKTDVVTGNCVMIQNNRFGVELTKYSSALVEVFKTIPSKAYDSQKRLWHFHLKDYNLLFEKFIRRSDCRITGLPKFTKEIFDKANQPTETNVDFSSIDETLMESLMPFQKEGISFGITKKGRLMIADDMGLGKTIQALGIADYYKDEWPLLIVTPSSVRYQWSEAIFKFLPSVPVQKVNHFTTKDRGFEFDKVTIVSYDLLSRSIDIFQNQFFGVVIFDESHFLKSSKTARYQAAEKIVELANHVILLSGTPALSRPMELYSQISLIFPKFMGATEFGIRYCDGVKSTFGWNFTGSSNLQELDLLLKAFCLLRRIKSDVLQQLPPKIRQVVVLDPQLIKAGTKEMEEMAMKLQKKTLTNSERHSALLKYYSESSVTKKKAICNYVTDLLETGEKFLVYAHHQGVLDAICHVIETKKIQYIRIDGRTNAEQRKCFVDRFQDEKEVLVAVLSITAANAGITLTAAQLVVFAELFWNPGTLCQAEDRVHRIGQDRGVVIQYLIGKNTVDDYLWPKIQRKHEVLNQVGLDQEFTVKDDNVSVQVAIDSDQKQIDEFVNGESSSNSNRILITKPCTIPSTFSSSSSSSAFIKKNQMRLDSFFSHGDNCPQNDLKGNENKVSENSNDLVKLLDDEDLFCDIDLNEFCN
ncbi:SWI/SNF-related matrix-associated actin-dependent regulator of chromatin subfamily A-like protein 1 [Leptopilina heterotoma]|uniref:SWI/SNF-related matrix-associated actin-dependent regulator of chromatin subfamily A-like protein 1 n=1 Tax=Leptopilina heterotoma TaxID=63436 RepID=UPI001CA82016|nr:SWI/SNF-related matrix-associated actin-dependent regulator of chromatin subfamily A-like protein 1 [Leptopilina heterotoma]XP_043480132.1 SWI/SNF-related matrix-associated actin-dependent regulator of chromatin subfamily A-like protein 1 [Leptopilina heterotoma]